MHPVTLSFRVAVGSLTADVVSPDRLVPCYRFIRCSFSSLQLSRHLHRCILRCTTSSTGAEKLRPGPLTCSLSRSMVLAPVLQFGTTGASGATDLLAPALHIAPVLGHRCIRPLPDRPVQGYRFIRCNCFFVELVQFILSLSSFIVFYFTWPFYFISGI